MNLRTSVLIIAIVSICANYGQNEIEQILWTAKWSPDGSQFAVGGTQGVLKFYASADNSVIKEVPIEGTITRVKWHPSGEMLAIVTQGKTSGLQILDLTTDVSYHLDEVAETGARAIDWSPDGKTLAIGDYESNLSFFNVKGELQRQINTGSKAIIALSWHPTQPLLVMVSEDITIYNIESGVIRSWKNRDDEVLLLCVEWHPSGEFFALGDYGDNFKPLPPLLQFWSADGELLFQYDESEAEFRNIRWSKDGTRLATASEALRIFDINGNVKYKASSPAFLWGVDWQPNDEQIVTGDGIGMIRLWSAQATPVDSISF